MPKPKCQRNWTRLGAFNLLLFLAVPSGFSAEAPAGSFNGGRAFADLKRLVEFGPRPAGSAALAESRRWILAQLKDAGAQVEEDSFTASTPLGPIPMTNLIAKFPGEQSRIVMVTGHYDTKLFENFRFVGANDGASSAALLLELAREAPRYLAVINRYTTEAVRRIEFVLARAGSGTRICAELRPIP